MAPPENIGEKTVRWGDSNGKRVPETLSPDHIDSDEGPKLTPLGRYQVNLVEGNFLPRQELEISCLVSPA